MQSWKFHLKVKQFCFHTFMIYGLPFDWMDVGSWLVTVCAHINRARNGKLQEAADLAWHSKRSEPVIRQ